MTAKEASAALERIGQIERLETTGSDPEPLAFGAPRTGVWERLEEELRSVAEALQVFVQTEDKRVGTVVTDWSGDVFCVWAAGADEAERIRHLERSQVDFAARIRMWAVFAAAVKAAVALSKLAAAPLTVVSAIGAAWELVEQVALLRSSMSGET